MNVLNIRSLTTTSLTQSGALYVKNKTRKKISWPSAVNRTCFSKKGLSKLEKALEKFEKHQASTCHRSATTHEVVIPQCRDVIEMIDTRERENRATNRRCFITILESLQYLARHTIP